MSDASAALPDDPAVPRQLLSEARTEIARLQTLIAALPRHRFGRRSERLDEAAPRQAIEDLEQSLAEQQAKLAAATPAAAPASASATEATPPARPASAPKRNRGSLPAHLPRIEVVVDVADRSCPCCQGPPHPIGEDRAEMLDYVPARLRVKVIRRPRHGCRACEGAVVQAPAPERPIDGGLATEALLAHVLISKYADYLPLYRQCQILARQGVILDRSTLCTWVGRACWWLAPLHQLILGTVLSSPCVFADDTPLPVLEPGRGKTRTGRLWCYAVDPRPWAGPGHPAAAYLYSEDRKGAHPAAHLKDFRGALQVDGYAGFARLAGTKADPPVKLAFCLAHARRKFHEVHAATGSPIALEALQRIAALYAIEAEIRGRPAEARRVARQERTKPLLAAMHAWLAEQLPRLSGRSTLAQAIRYALKHWDGLTLFVDDGRLEPDTNTVERAIRPVALARKNALFAGADSGGRHWAITATLIQTARLNDIEPWAWLTDVLESVVSGRTKSHELHTLLPWNWKPPNQNTAAQAA